MTEDPTTHVHISEREADGTWEDCTWDSGLEFYRDAYDPSKPATHAEAQALRAASGEPTTGGSNIGDLRRGVKARYGFTLPLPIDAKTILTALKPGYVSTVQGSMSAFGPDHPLSAWDRNFDGGHAVWLARTLDGKLLWCDPEAPRLADVPVVVTSGQVQKFVDAFAGQALVAPALQWPTPPQEDAVEPITKYLPGYTANVKPSSNVRNAPHIPATKLYTTSTKTPVTLIGTVKGDIDPSNGLDIWYMWWDSVRKTYAFTATDNIVDLKAPAVDDGYTKATQDAAVAAAVDAQKAADALALAAAVTDATAHEKERIALAMGEASAEAIRQV